jgi:hypothetical protein
MSLLSHKGTLSTPAATGSQVYTGVGFQPQAVIFFATKQTATGFAAGYCIGFGCATSASARKSLTISSFDNHTGAALAGRAANTAIELQSVDPSSSLKVDADLSSLDADGFTLNWTTVDAANAYIVHYIAIGGSSVTNALAGEFTPNTSTGAQAVTGVGFQPDCLLFFGTRLTAATDYPQPRSLIFHSRLALLPVRPLRSQCRGRKNWVKPRVSG